MLPHKPRYFSYVIPFTCRPTWRMQMLSRRRSDAGHQFRRRCVQVTRRFPHAPNKYSAARAIRVSNPESSDDRGFFPGIRAIYELLIKYPTVSTVSPTNGAYPYMRRACYYDSFPGIAVITTASLAISPGDYRLQIVRAVTRIKSGRRSSSAGDFGQKIFLLGPIELRTQFRVDELPAEK